MEAPKENLQKLTRILLKALADSIGAIFSLLSGVPGAVKSGFVAAAQGVRSPDRPTRRMSWIFFLSVIAIVLSLGGFGKYWYAHRADAKEARLALERKKIDDLLRAEELRKSREPPPYQTLGTFTLELREQEGVAKSSGLRAAEMEIVVACSEIAVCDWIKNHIDLSRGELGGLFTPTDREKILSTGGKKAFREEIRDTLNRLLEERGVTGSVIEVLFPRFIVS